MFLGLVQEQKGEYFKTTEMTVVSLYSEDWKNLRGHSVHSPGSSTGLMLISHHMDSMSGLLGSFPTGDDIVWLGRGPVTDQLGSESPLRPFRASVFPGLLLQAGQSDRVDKTIKKARTKKKKTSPKTFPADIQREQIY